MKTLSDSLKLTIRQLARSTEVKAGLAGTTKASQLNSQGTHLHSTLHRTQTDFHIRNETITIILAPLTVHGLPSKRTL